MNRSRERCAMPAGNRIACHVEPASVVFARPSPVPVQPAMNPTDGVKRCTADSEMLVGARVTGPVSVGLCDGPTDVLVEVNGVEGVTVRITGVAMDAHAESTRVTAARHAAV